MEKDVAVEGAVVNEGERSSSPFSMAHGTPVGPLGPGQRWSAGRKREVVLRLLRAEPVELLSRELGVEMFRLDEWRDKALAGIDASLKERGGDLVKVELDAALKRIGELTMENELLRARMEKPGPLGRRRSRR
ncbi:MAG: IS3 family transposase [bacterium]|nr:IS3 family transposase [bacterium]